MKWIDFWGATLNFGVSSRIAIAVVCKSIKVRALLYTYSAHSIKDDDDDDDDGSLEI